MHDWQTLLAAAGHGGKKQAQPGRRRGAPWGTILQGGGAGGAQAPAT